MPYVPSYDGLRAAAVLLVLAFHARVPGFGAGNLGVDVFFVLSGFLITRLLLVEHEQTGSVSVMRFYGRRLLRLYPALALMLVCYAAAAPFLIPELDVLVHLNDAVLSGFYLTNVARVDGYSVNYLSHSWSLALEQQFYLLWPMVILAVAGWSAAGRIRFFILLFAAATLWRIWQTAFGAPGIGPIYYGQVTHASGLILGALLAQVPLRLKGPWAAGGGAGLVFAMAFCADNSIEEALSGQTVAELSAGALILAQPRWLGWAPLAWLGQMSYGIYLWHYPFMRVLRMAEWHWALTFSLGAAFAIVMAFISYHTVEAWVRRRKARARQAVPAAA
jgi:peptidoglycan/LPS O-acetylase OafA/YrhL